MAGAAGHADDDNSPPDSLNPGTSHWGFAAFTVAAGTCKLAAGSPNTAAGAGYP